MPELGETKLGKDIGKAKWSRYIWAACGVCGKERWVRFLKGRPKDFHCLSCERKSRIYPTGSATSNWKGGQWHSGKGYLYIKLAPDDFFHPMMNKAGYVQRDRLVMAKHLGRCLQPWEKVHHKDGIKDHDDLSNLELTTAGNHIIMHNKGYRDGYQRGLSDGRIKQIQELKAEIQRLQEGKMANPE